MFLLWQTVLCRPFQTPWAFMWAWNTHQPELLWFGFTLKYRSIADGLSCPALRFSSWRQRRSGGRTACSLAVPKWAVTRANHAGFPNPPLPSLFLCVLLSCELTIVTFKVLASEWIILRWGQQLVAHRGLVSECVYSTAGCADARHTNTGQHHYH